MAPRFAFHAQSTDKLLIALDNGRFYTLGAQNLPGARGFGEPVRNMLDMENEAQIIALMPYDPAGKLLLAASNGRGFLAEMPELIAETRKGRQVVNLKAGVRLTVIRPVPGECRSCRGGGRKPQAGGFPAHRTAGDGARAGGAAAALPRWRAVRCDHLPAGRRPELDDGRR